MVIVRKNISVQPGERALLDEIRYFFYITNRNDKPAKMVGLANGRCDQENVIEQLKNGVNALRMPVHDLLSNWAYMVMAALAWNLKAWYGLLTPNRERGGELVRMEFRRFLIAELQEQCRCVERKRVLRGPSPPQKTTALEPGRVPGGVPETDHEISPKKFAKTSSEPCSRFKHACFRSSAA